MVLLTQSYVVNHYLVPFIIIFGLGLGLILQKLASALASGFWPRLTSLLGNSIVTVERRNTEDRPRLDQHTSWVKGRWPSQCWQDPTLLRPSTPGAVLFSTPAARRRLLSNLLPNTDTVENVLKMFTRKPS